MRRFIAVGRNEGFTCVNCGLEVPPLAGGSCRNHCPACLHSLHVDVHPGDRANACAGLLVPIGIEHDARKGWVVVHRCARCGAVRRNRAAHDDPAMPDDMAVLVGLSAEPTPAGEEQGGASEEASGPDRAPPGRRPRRRPR